jgi:hypothetical protein
MPSPMNSARHRSASLGSQSRRHSAQFATLAIFTSECPWAEFGTEVRAALPTRRAVAHVRRWLGRDERQRGDGSPRDAR